MDQTGAESWWIGTGAHNADITAICYIPAPCSTPSTIVGQCECTKSEVQLIYTDNTHNWALFVLLFYSHWCRKWQTYEGSILLTGINPNYGMDN